MQNLAAELATGPIPFDRFMELALYESGGFFDNAILRSTAAGDFLTSPEVSPLFGATLARFVRAEHERLGDPFAVVEIGAGSGSLLASLLAEYPVDAWAIERSPPAREQLSALLPSDRIGRSLEDLPTSIRGVVIANELIDNLPMALAQRQSGHWRERWVALDGDGLVLVDADPRPAVADWLARFAGPVGEGGWVEAQVEASVWLRSLLSRMSAGAVILIDYGELAENLAHRRATGTLRTYRAHHLGPDPLLEPGTTDITADVNFSALIATATEPGWTTELLRQDDFLRSLGLDVTLAELKRQELDAIGQEEIKRLEFRSERNAGETLLHERGLGDFRVLIARHALK